MEKFKFGIIRGKSVPGEPMTTNITNAIEALNCEFYAEDILTANKFAQNVFRVWSESDGVRVGAGKYIITPVVLAHLYE